MEGKRKKIYFTRNRKESMKSKYIYWKGEREREEIEKERKENREGKDPTAWKKVKNEKY